MPQNADTQKIAQAISRAGIDPRHWCSHGTVGTVGDDGTFDPNDAEAVAVAPDGVWVDVLLEPLGIAVTARVQLGVGGARAVIQVPILPGDEVLVSLPDGILSNGPIVSAILNSQSAKIPLNNGTPIFQNDRVLLYSAGQDVDVRAIGGDVTLSTDGTVKLGGRDADEPLVLGSRWKTRMENILDGLIDETHGTPVGPTTVPVNAATYTAERALLATDLSEDNFTKKTNNG